MMDFITKITVEQWIKIVIAILALIAGGSFIVSRVYKINKAKVKNVKNSKIDIRQENK